MEYENGIATAELFSGTGSHLLSQAMSANALIRIPAGDQRPPAHRRGVGVGQNPGVHVAGVGAEIALEPLNMLIQGIVPGATMRGPQ